MKKSNILIVFAVLALLLASCATSNKVETVNTVQAVEPAEPEVVVTPCQVSVNGNGSVALKADVVTFQIYVSETAKTTGAAQQLTNEKISAVLDILRAFGITDENIKTTGLNFNTEYWWNDGVQIKKGESVSQSIYVKMKNLESFPVLVDTLSTVSGITLSGVSFDVEDKSAAVAKARELAYQDAYNKALAYANQAGLTIVGPTLINEDSYYSNNSVRFDMALATMATADEKSSISTEAPSGLLNVSVNVSVTFLMY
ncbi:MAG: SIMPL domain-containing protein [Sphaerochaetaceae bacterium]|nr:SIMPL domain-containing protein [Sphaerochaetaceae bacterium]